MDTQPSTKFSEIEVQNHNRHGSGGRAEQQRGPETQPQYQPRSSGAGAERPFPFKDSRSVPGAVRMRTKGQARAGRAAGPGSPTGPAEARRGLPCAVTVAPNLAGLPRRTRTP
ncbi:uncharacterized protein LOC143441770 [Arvicanthis niloticus]|uniref:uncharacterized protein LOC143441770 n=1 Tax=Arvicanthis niloticus TaxID=61156 RepID=UPI00403C4EA0